MTLSSEQFREQLVDYLYGELEGDSLREFEASLRASELCRRELEAMKETLRISREGVPSLRALDDAPPSRVNSAIMAAAAAQARELLAEPGAVRSRADEPRAEAGAPRRGGAPSLWSWLRTPWLLPTLGVAAAVSIVVLHKRVESPKMPGYESASDVRSQARGPASTPRADEGSSVPAALPSAAAADPLARASGGARESASPLERQPGAAAGAGPHAEGAAPSKSSAQTESDLPRAQAPRASTGDRGTRARMASPSAASAGVRSASADRLSAERADEALAAPPGGAANDQGAPSNGYAVPPPAWTGAAREESAKKETSRERRASVSSVPAQPPPASIAVSEEREAAPEQDKAVGSLGASSAARAGGGTAPAAKPARARPASSEPEPAVPPKAAARAPSAPADDARPVVAAEPATRAPDESVKRALEHANARRFSQAAVAYRELLARYPKDPRAPEWRKQLTAMMQALSKVDSIR